MSDEEIKIIDKWVNILYPIAGNFLFLDEFYKNETHIDFAKNRNAYLKDESILLQSGIIKTVKFPTTEWYQHFTDLGYEVYEAGGWNQYKAKKKKKADRVERRENFEDFKIRFWWLGWLAGAILGSIITHYVPKIMDGNKDTGNKTETQQDNKQQIPQTKIETNKPIPDSTTNYFVF